jgi:hypothetical protein
MTRPIASVERVDGTSAAFSYKLVAGGIAVVLLALGGQQIGDVALRAYAESGFDLQQAVTPQDLEPTQSRVKLLERTDDWFGDPQARIDAGVYEFRIAFGSDSERKLDPTRLKNAIDDLSDGLRRAPANPLAWASLGEARFAAGDKGGALSALNASLLLGPYERELVLYRSDLGLKLWPDLDANLRRAVALQVRLAWDSQPYALVALAKSTGRTVPVMIALAQDPRSASNFMKVLAERR